MDDLTKTISEWPERARAALSRNETHIDALAETLSSLQADLQEGKAREASLNKEISALRRDRQRDKRKFKTLLILTAPYLLVLFPITLLLWYYSRRSKKRRQLHDARVTTQLARDPLASPDLLPERREAIVATGLFDPAWYLSENPGVALTGDDPLENCLRTGRRPNPNFDPKFYRDTYWDIAALSMNPFAHYVSEGEQEGRAINRAHAVSLVKDSIAEHPGPDVAQGAQGAHAKTVSYCIPIMNRLEDIQGTLETNLNENRSYSDRVEFVVAAFEADGRTADWIETTFPDDLAAGYLRLLKRPPLDGWHFGKAKNTFQSETLGSIYSSLDGDNFVTAHETAQLLDLVDRHDINFLAHHFSGNWGDGTSGRVSLASGVYRLIGYDEMLLPRQFDEMDLILSTLRRFPAMPYLCHDPKSSALALNGRIADFRIRERVVNPILQIDRPTFRDPLNPRGKGYVKADAAMNAMQHYNQAASFRKNARNDDNIALYRKFSERARMDLVEATDPKKLLSTLFESDEQRIVPEMDQADICVFACMKNDEVFLDAFLAHYRARGVRAFFIVDDHSDTPIGQMGLGDDVFVFRPKVGRFQSAKAMWLSALIHAFVPTGAWVLTVDADEFIDLPDGMQSFAQLASETRAKRRDFVPALMLDMLPRPGLNLADLKKNPDNFTDDFHYVAHVDTPVTDSYLTHPSITWGFGASAVISWAVDARYHAFGTFDSLSKIPFYQTRKHRHPHQGFHTLCYSDKTAPPGPEIWEQDMILPLRHYKLAKMLRDTARLSAPTVQGAYHERTAANIIKIADTNLEDRFDRLVSLPSKPVEQWEPVKAVPKRRGLFRRVGTAKKQA